ncbi:MAG: chaperone modulator CbpM [Candidatus Azobacteroides sp.]|nr:chaperone modulator CbpM [Candidatus Azobacteroides sp.]
MKTDLIVIDEYIQHTDIEPTFIQLLEENGLIHIRQIENERFLDPDELIEVERYARMYYDLSINIEGIDAIRHLLNRIKGLQNEMRSLRSRLRLFE